MPPSILADLLGLTPQAVDRWRLVGLRPTGPAGRGYRATRTAAVLNGAVVRLLMIVAVPIGVLLVPLAVPQLGRAAPWAAGSLIALWGAVLLTHPEVAAGVRHVRLGRRPAGHQGAASWWRTPWSGVAGPRRPPTAWAWR